MSDFALIETMRFEPGTGIVRAAHHRDRLAHSAEVFGFEGADAAHGQLKAYLESLPALTHRVRLELAANGACAITSAPFAPLPQDTIWSVVIAKTRLHSDPQTAGHKTTRRSIYEAARSEFDSSAIQEVLLLSAENTVAEGTITNVFLETAPGQYRTPPLKTGCLNGVLRRAMIEQGKAKEADIRLADLQRGPFYVGNSLRGLIRAKLEIS